MAERFEAVVIGTGFGGAVAACRLGKRWPGKVLVLERGKRYPMGSFPRSPHDMARNFWNLPDETVRRPRRLRAAESHGMWDIRSFRHMDVVLGAGLGGGSLVYANVFLEPPGHVFDGRWPASAKKEQLARYFGIAKRVLGARPVPRNADPRRRILRTELFERYAAEVGRKSELVDINVFFGNDLEHPDDPLPIGEQARNRYGALQTSCVYCAECDVGCNVHAKNTLDLNYLFVAEQSHQAVVKTECLAVRIAPLGAGGEPDPAAGGEHGYRVWYRDLTRPGSGEIEVRAERVVVSAGTIGSNELLLRCRDVDRTLPNVSRELGKGYSGNGDFLSFVIGTDRPAEPNYGPVITQRTDFDLYENFDPERAFLFEDASYPAFASWFVEGAKPGFMRLGAFGRMLRHAWSRFVDGHSMGSMGYALGDLLSGDLSYNTAVLLCMGFDRSDGVISLDHAGRADIDWPYRNSRPLYDAILGAGRRFSEVFGAKAFVPLPTWHWPARKNVSVHSLGGCRLAGDPAAGVTSADPASFGEVFGYRNLYVADGAILPTAVGANPTATITALAEMVAEGITGIEPDERLV